MCIAIYSPKGNEIPCEDYLRNSFLYNPDGAGFAYNTKEHNVKIEKGFMDWNSFWKAFQKADKKNNFKNCGVLIHFRIATHGGTNKECCHPFPLVSDANIMKKTKCKCDYAVIHNGIIHLTSSDTFGRDKMSDTMVFIEKYLSKIASNKKWFKNKTNFDLIYDLIDSKMAILNGYGEIHSTAGFVKDDDGNWYSNTSYREARNRYLGSSNKLEKVCDKYGTSYYKDYNDYDDFDDGFGMYGSYERDKYLSQSDIYKSEDDKDDELYIGVQKLKSYMMVFLEDGTIFEYDEKEDEVGIGYFLSEDNAVYYGTFEGKTVETADFVGYGEFVYSCNVELTASFVPDFKMPLDLICEYTPNQFDEEII